MLVEAPTLQEGFGEFDGVFCTGELGEEALLAFNQLGEDYRTESLPAVIIVEKNQTSLIMMKFSTYMAYFKCPLKCVASSSFGETH